MKNTHSLALAAVLASAVSASTADAETFAHWAFDRMGACMGALSGGGGGGARLIGTAARAASATGSAASWSGKLPAT